MTPSVQAPFCHAWRGFLLIYYLVSTSPWCWIWRLMESLFDILAIDIKYCRRGEFEKWYS